MPRLRDPKDEIPDPSEVLRKPDGVRISAPVFISCGIDPVRPPLDKQDERPKEGEFFMSRGIGLDVTPGCFVCGGKRKLYNNVSGFMRSKDAGERVVAMFENGAWLDYRENEPNWIQVKVGACDKHLDNLKRLHDLTKQEKGIITAQIITEAGK